MFHKREFYFNKIISAFEVVPIVILIGARQVGKTTLMRNISLKEKSIFLNGQDTETAEKFKNLSTLESYLKIKLNATLKGFLLIDEFQYIPGISTMLKLLTDKYEEVKIFCSGSSSLNIIQKVEESLAGRVRMIDVFSLSFEEYLQFSNNELYEIYAKYTADTPSEIIENSVLDKLNEYLVYGGLPRIALTSNEETKTELLDDIYRTYLMSDVKSFIRNEDSVGFNRLLRMLSAQIGNMVNINELSRISRLSYKKCEEYIYLLEQMYIIFLIEPYFTNKRKVISKMKKVYFLDLGLRNRIYNSFNPVEFRTDNGSIFENYIFLEIKRNLSKSSEISYFRTNDGTEIDFIIETPKNKYAVEAKYKTFKNPVIFRGLLNFAEQENFDKMILVNNNLNQKYKSIQYIPGCLISKVF